MRLPEENYRYLREQYRTRFGIHCGKFLYADMLKFERQYGKRAAVEAFGCIQAVGGGGLPRRGGELDIMSHEGTAPPHFPGVMWACPGICPRQEAIYLRFHVGLALQLPPSRNHLLKIGGGSRRCQSRVG